MTGVSAHEGLTASVSATNLATAHRWIRAKFEGLQETKPAEGCLMGGWSLVRFKRMRSQHRGMDSMQLLIDLCVPQIRIIHEVCTF